MVLYFFVFFFSSRRRHTRFALVSWARAGAAGWRSSSPMWPKDFSSGFDPRHDQSARTRQGRACRTTRNGAFGRRADVSRVFAEHAVLVLGRGRLVVAQAFHDLGVAQVHVELATFDVEGDRIAGLDGRC